MTDVNDNSPQFTEAVYHAEILENTYLGVSITQVTAYDLDLGENAKIVYFLSDADHQFTVNPEKGLIEAKTPFDREKADTHRFTVYAADTGSPPRTGSATVELTILDVNDERPEFSLARYSFDVEENGEAGSAVGRVAAIDRDATPYNSFSYGLPEAEDATYAFSIDTKTGVISTTRSLDREDRETYQLVVVAREDNVYSSEQVHSSTAVVIIRVTDVNDHGPVFAFPVENNNTVSVMNLAPRGHIVTTVKAFDLDGHGNNSRLEYTILGGNPDGRFSLDERTGTIWLTRNLKGDPDNQVRATIMQ